MKRNYRNVFLSNLNEAISAVILGVIALELRGWNNIAIISFGKNYYETNRARQCATVSFAYTVIGAASCLWFSSVFFLYLLIVVNKNSLLDNWKWRSCYIWKVDIHVRLSTRTSHSWLDVCKIMFLLFWTVLSLDELVGFSSCKRP